MIKSLANWRLPHWGFWVSMLVMTAMGAGLFSAAHEARESAELLTRSYVLLQTIRGIDEQLSRAESTNRAYLLSGNHGLLVERDQAFLTARDITGRLESLAGGDPARTALIKALAEELAVRSAIMRDSPPERLRDGGVRLSAEVIRKGLISTARIQDLTQQMERDEERLLAMRRSRVEQAYDSALLVTFVTALIAILILLPGYIGFSVQSRARQRAEEKLHAVADGMPGAIYKRRSRPDGTSLYEFVSPGARELRGIDDETAMRDPASVWNTVVPEDRAGLAAAIVDAERTLTRFDFQFRVTLPNGEVRWLRDWAALRREPDGSTVWNGQWADITAQKELERALQEAKDVADRANRAKSTFLAVMSHEIRTPMNSLLGMLELLSLTELSDAQRGTLSVVRESGQSLQRIIDDILDFSKIEAGRLEIVPAVASIRDIVEEVRLVYSGNASSKGLSLRCTVDPHVSPAVIVDPLRLRQIIGNLVSNAIKFTSAGHVEIGLDLIERTEQLETVHFSVTDTGVGISAENQKRLFEPFTQVGGEHAQHVGGTGLGLAICRRLAGLMGGSIDVASSPGRGTTVSFTVSLPVADPAHLDARRAVQLHDVLGSAFTAPRVPQTVEEAERDGTLVLLVDDHPTNRMLLCRQVNTLGYAVESAGDGIEALRKWRSGRYGLVITDCNMPVMDGYKLARRIRKIEARSGLSRTPIVACTANALRGEAESCFAAGMDDFVAKPVELVSLLMKLHQWLPLPDELPARRSEPDQGIAAPHIDSEPFDAEVLAVVSGADAAVERPILEEFRRVNDEDAAALEAALARGDLALVTRISHRVQGAARMVGAMPLAASAESIGAASRGRDTPGVHAAHAAFVHELQRMNAHLDADAADHAGHPTAPAAGEGAPE